jgi:hypothetical protein
VEQKNGAVVRRVVGYRRLEGLEAATALARLFVNFFQPSFKLQTGREGARRSEGAQALSSSSTPLSPAGARSKDFARGSRPSDASYTALDPVRLLSDMRTAQQQLVDIADRPLCRPVVSYQFAFFSVRALQGASKSPLTQQCCLLSLLCGCSRR